MCFSLILWIARLVACAGCLTASLASAQTRDGARWEIPQGAQPQLALGSDGRIWLTYAKAGDVFAAHSRDNGVTFSAPTRIATVPGIMVGMRRGPRIAANGERVTVTAIAHELIAFHSSDGGRTWSKPAVVNDVPTAAREGLHDLARAPDGTLFVTWLDLRNGAMELWGAESKDAGLSWSGDQQIYRSPDKSICTCCQPSAVFDASGTLAVMWRNSIGGARDMWFSTRAPGGAAFGTPRKLGDGSWNIEGCPMDGGRIIATSNGSFASVWQRAGDVFFCPATGAEIPLGQGKQPVAIMRGGEPVVLWQRGPELVSATVAPNASATSHAADARFPVLVSLQDGSGAVLAYEYGPAKEPSLAIERILQVASSR